MALGEEPIEAGGALPSLSEGLMTGSHLLQVLAVVVVVPRGPQQFESKVTLTETGIDTNYCNVECRY